MPEFDIEATIDEVEYVADEDALPDRPLDPPPVLPMIPLSSKDLVMLTNPEPFQPGQVGLDLDTLNEAAARLGNSRWYLFRPKEAPARFNTTFVLPWPGTYDPQGRMRLQCTGQRITDTFQANMFTPAQNRDYFSRLEAEMEADPPSTRWNSRWWLGGFTYTSA